MEKQYGHHVAASLPAESDTGLSAKKIMEEGNLPTFTLQEVSPYYSCHLSDMLTIPMPTCPSCLRTFST